MPSATTDTRHWVNQAVRKIEADFNRSSDTHLIKLDLPALNNITLYLKDESTHPTEGDFDAPSYEGGGSRSIGSPSNPR